MANTNSINEIITREAAKEALLRSGYLLENRIESVLRGNYYYAVANNAYPDPITSKPREYDIDALKATLVYKKEYIFTNLLIECINNPQPIAFITKEPTHSFLHNYDIKFSGLPFKIYNPKDNYWNNLAEYLKMNDYHHYCNGRIATQFCSFNKKKSGNGNKEEWMASHNDDHYDVFRKLANVLNYQRKQHFDSLKNIKVPGLNLIFYYPVLVVQGELWEAIPSTKSVSFKKSNHLQYRYSTITDNKELTYHIDVVTEKFFPKYLQLLEDEITKTSLKLKRRSSIIKDSSEKLVEKIKTNTSGASIQTIFDEM